MALDVVVLLNQWPGRPATEHASFPLVGAIADRGHRVSVVDERDLRGVIAGGAAALLGPNGPIAADVAVTRILGSGWGRALAAHLEAAGMAVVNTPAASRVCGNKFWTADVLAGCGVPVPDQELLTAKASEDDIDAAFTWLGPRLVCKELAGSMGRDVTLHDSPASLAAYLAGRGGTEPVMVQRFVQEAAGCDVRMLVLGGRFCVAMQRQAKPGEFRANLSQGGTGRRWMPSEAEVEVSERAARAIGADIAGVDLLLTKDGPLVCEVNAVPGLAGIGRATGVDVFAAAAEAVEAAATRALS